MSFSFGTQKQKSTSTSTTDPWKVATPYVTDFLSGLPKMTGTTGAETDAIKSLETTAGQGNPYAGQIDSLTKDLFATQSQSPMVADAYGAFQDRLTPTANGQNLGLNENPYLQQMMQQNSDLVAQRINAQFAGAGRDLSGANQMAVGKGVTEAQLPLLFDQYNREQGRTDTAARDLFGAAPTAANTMQNLDIAASGQRQAGIEAGNAALDAKTWGPQQIVALEEKLKTMPYDEASKLADILFGAAGLGQQSTGQSVGKSSSMGAKFDVGSILKGLAAAMAGGG